MRRTVSILGTPIDRLTRQETLARICCFVHEGGFHQVATANTDFLVNALQDPELSTVLLSADLVTPDGMPIVWAARALRSGLPERVTGADIVPEIAEMAARCGFSVFLLGARESVARRAAERLKLDYPDIQIAGCLSPPSAALDDLDSPALLQQIQAAKPDILLVAFGNPKQEKWIYRHRKELQSVSVCMGVGGTFDFLAGEYQRAPMWMQRHGLEWLHRLAQDPTRLWKRYNRDFWLFGFGIAREIMFMRRLRSSGNGGSRLQKADDHDGVRIAVHGDLCGEWLGEFYASIDAGIARGESIQIDLSGVTSVDGEGLGALIELRRRTQERNIPCTFGGMSVALASLLTVSLKQETLASETPVGRSLHRYSSTG
jgi:exopolysaccharide biosynthesis WecB/TagA/CpsF family protein